MIRNILYCLGSAYGALFLVLAVAACSVVGAISPQEGAASALDIESWSVLHPVLTRIINPWGGFHVFSSRLFLIVLGLLSINIISCTIAHLFFDGNKEERTRLEIAGFLMIHVAILIVIAGGFISAGWRFDGRIILIEGQSWVDGSESYPILFKGPFLRFEHPGFEITLERVEQRFEGKNHQVDLKSHFLVPDVTGKTRKQILMVNDPFTLKGLTFTQDQVGFAPRLAITPESGGMPVMDSFLALKRLSTPNGSEHRDVVPMFLDDGTLIITMFPSSTWTNGIAWKTGEAPDSPVVKLEYGSGASHPPPVFLKLDGEASIAGYRVRFTDWRYWSMYRVSADPGYPLVCFGLWLGLAAMVIRYGRVMISWWSGKDPAYIGSGKQ